jgi:hypothetical protein
MTQTPQHEPAVTPSHKCKVCGGVPVTATCGSYADCPPAYDPQMAVRLVADGFPDTAEAYAHNWPEAS